jgi:RNA polymerase sigma factor (sigma-70 family)
MKTTLLRSTTSLQSDDRLVEMVRAGVEPAFNTIVERYRSPLLRYASRVVDADRAEDVVQEALVKAHSSLLQDDREIQLKPWLYRITHNLALDAVRQKSWNYDQLDDNYDGVRQPPDYLEQKERLRSIIEHMDTLPERQKRALILQAFEGRSSEEIARELDDGVPEARQLVHRARVRMRNAFGALIPIPVLLWLNKSTASAATTSASGSKMLLGGALRTGVAKFATTGAIAVMIGAGAGIAVGETAIKNGAAEPVADVSPVGGAKASTSSDSSSHARKRSGSRADGSGSTAAVPGDAGSSNGTGAGGGNDSGSSPSADHNSAPGASDSESGDSPSAPAQQPSGSSSSGSGAGSTGSGAGSTGSGGGSTGDGSTGGGSTGGGSTGGGSTGGGSDQTCIGPVAQLPPICLPNLQSGSGSGSSLPSLP